MGMDDNTWKELRRMVESIFFLNHYFLVDLPRVGSTNGKYMNQKEEMAHAEG